MIEVNTMKMKMSEAMFALLLAFTLVLSLAACGQAADAPSEQSERPSQTEDGGDAQEPEANSAVPLGALLTTDESGREPYKIAYLCNMLTWAWNKSISDTLEKIGGTLNYEYTAYAANNDYDAFINQIYTFADQGYDAFVLGTDDQLAARAIEAAKECGVAFIAESTSFVDGNGVCIWPSVQQAQTKNGEQTVQWLVDNYKTYWGDIDLSDAEVGLIGLDYSAVSGIHERRPGVEAKFKEFFPNGKYFDGDLVAMGNDGFSVQGGNMLTSQILSQNPDTEKWFVVAFVDDWAVGATRAVESLQMEDRVLVASIQADAFLAEMNSGYSGDVYVAACAVSSVEFAIDMANALVSILDGTTSAEDLWPEWRDEGGSYPRVQVEGTIITRDTYGDYLAVQEDLLP
jgi:ABC-type sugar transport system substrate-binding protein